jgi:hypothetical protein
LDHPVERVLSVDQELQRVSVARLERVLCPATGGRVQDSTTQTRQAPAVVGLYGR